MAELLLELFSEEIPARMQQRAARDLEELVTSGLREADLAFEQSEAHATPRRLVLSVRGLAERQPDRRIERKGPKVDAPDKAKRGFLDSLEGETYRLEERADKKGAVLFALIERVGRPASEVACEILANVLPRFPWPKSMRWGSGEARWVRPLHSILFVIDGEVPAFEFAGIEAGALGYGHRFLAPDPFEARDFAEYRNQLSRRFVVLDHETRKNEIRAGAVRLAHAAGHRVKPDEALIDELAGLVEWPVPFLGAIDARFMAVPPEALITSMREHQKYLALETDDGALAPAFVAVANTEAADGGAAIRAGAERVLRARLHDAEFFFLSDKKTALAERLPELDRMVFHDKLGTTGDKARRIEALARAIAERIEPACAEDAARAARLAKADLVTQMVGEFPELQGVMGRRYAAEHGESEAVALAIGEHYKPQGPNDPCPEAPTSLCVAIADKLDTLAGFFAAGVKPTGSKDPFALRRAALGVIRMTLERKLRLPLLEAFESALEGFGDRFDAEARGRAKSELLDFFHDRVSAHLRSEGIGADRVKAVAAAGVEDDVFRLVARVGALDAFLASEDGANLLAGLGRAANIVAIEAKKDGGDWGEPDASAPSAPEEAALANAVDRATRTIEPLLAREDWRGAMTEVAALRDPVDRFFDAVLVNDDDPRVRRNRLLLLQRIGAALAPIAEFSNLDAG